MIQVASVDQSAGTVACCMALGTALAARWGPPVAAEALAVLARLLVAPGLTPGQFAASMQCAP